MKSKKTTLRPNLILLFCAAVFLITTGSMLLIGSIFVLLIHMGFFIRPPALFPVFSHRRIQHTHQHLDRTGYRGKNICSD